MIGFPEFILDPKELDDVYDGVSDSCQSSFIIHSAGDRLMREVVVSVCCWLMFIFGFRLTASDGALLPPVVKHHHKDVLIQCCVSV